MTEKKEIFSNQELKNMIVPLFMEQFLLLLVGLADTLVVSYAGEAAVSGVSLVNQFNTVFIFLFTALAAGGAVIISQYIGRKDNELAGESSSQLLMFSTIFSVVLMAAVLLTSRPLLRLMFGRVEEDVMSACVTYLRISAYSYPALAVYNAGAALCRSMGKTKIRRAKADGKEGIYEEDDFRQLGLVRFLLSAGFTQKETKRYLDLTKDGKTNEEQIRMLRKQRLELLKSIHEKQQILDQIDYMIWEKKRG